MALFAVIGDKFVAKILRQIASDYDLDYDEMKSRYCGASSFEQSVPAAKAKVKDKSVPVPDEIEVPVPVPVKAKAVVPRVPDVVPEPVVVAKKKMPTLMAFSKMKKGDLVSECEMRDIDSEGTVAQLKERIKEARALDDDAPPPKVKAPPKAKGSPKPKAKGKGKGKGKAAPPPPPPPPPVLLEEEEEEEDDELEEGDSVESRLRKMLESEDSFCGNCDEKAIEAELDDAQVDLDKKLREILAAGGGCDEDEDQEEDEDEDQEEEAKSDEDAAVYSEDDY